VFWPPKIWGKSSPMEVLRCSAALTIPMSGAATYWCFRLFHHQHVIIFLAPLQQHETVIDQIVLPDHSVRPHLLFVHRNGMLFELPNGLPVGAQKVGP